MKKEVVVSLIAVIFGLLAGAVLMAITGNNPVDEITDNEGPAEALFLG